MQWEDIIEAIDALVLKTADVAGDVRKWAGDVMTVGDVGYHYDPEADLVAIYPRGATLADAALCKRAAERAVGVGHVRETQLTEDEASIGGWVKVGYSPTVRRLGELLNFFPGKYPGGIPNAPSPVASMLTSGLVGAGLGYGAGRIGEAVLPKKYGKRLRYAGAALGGTWGAAPGLAWARSNRQDGLSIFDKQPLDQPSDMLRYDRLGSQFKNAVDRFCKEAFSYPDQDAHPFGFGAPHPEDVNINSVGQTLWRTGASPHTAGSTMAALYAAQQLPDPNARSGYATSGQLGQLALNAGKGYVTGALVGAALNAAVGMPHGPSAFGATGAALAVIQTVIPKLFQ